MNLQYYHDEFLDYMKAEKNASEATITSYTTDFRIFNVFLTIGGIEPRINTITTQVLRRYVVYLKQHKNYKNETVRRKINSLSSFFKFLLETEYIEKNPMLPIKAPKKEQNIPIYIKENELTRLLQAPEKYARFPEHRLRDKIMIELLVFTGARRSEVLSLDFDNVDFQAKTITILKAKGNKQRIVPLIEPLATDLWEYLQTRLPLTNRAILISDQGNRMSVSNFQNLFRRYLEKSGLGNKGYTIHKCRHSFASLLHQNGVDIISIKELLGHEDLNSTKIYTHTNVDHLRKQVEKFPVGL
ncbi:tyrosine-type recombinase/integrase [uncultured Tissierella sp.]|uniref:tyrosine-type recombinase/integrase n=1 Tax=uncultured Tissierella sp. TaxID=448160 RepID=UPI002805AC08|nr:tyrosine-type recombinase/integrase [uncultured Tissierella sp.]MDU5082827.1 tyrosine-type recombinase/integrase [Bacillota bacterium]